jgi:hypothetical protein
VSTAELGVKLPLTAGNKFRLGVGSRSLCADYPAFVEERVLQTIIFERRPESITRRSFSDSIVHAQFSKISFLLA